MSGEKKDYTGFKIGLIIAIIIILWWNTSDNARVKRIKELEELVENAVVIDEASIDSSVVSLGSTVTVRISDGKSESEVTYSLVGSNEADPFSGKISDLSPIGAGLVEMREGEEKEIETPSGTIRIKVLKVSRTNA